MHGLFMEGVEHGQGVTPWTQKSGLLQLQIPEITNYNFLFYICYNCSKFFRYSTSYIQVIKNHNTPIKMSLRAYGLV